MKEKKKKEKECICYIKCDFGCSLLEWFRQKLDLLEVQLEISYKEVKIVVQFEVRNECKERIRKEQGQL